MDINTKLVIFDLDNTLYDESLYYKLVVAKFLKQEKININTKNVINDLEIFKTKDVLGNILKQLKIYSNNRQRELFKVYKTLECSICIYKEAAELINFLKLKKIKIGIITNGVIEAQKNKVNCLDLENKVDKIIYARKWGIAHEKPSDKPFIEILKLFKVSNTEAIYIGDNPHTDIMGAKKAKIKCIRFLNGYLKEIKYNHQYNINNLFEIKSYL